MVQARKPESRFDRLEQGEVRVEFRALLAALSVVVVHDGLELSQATVAFGRNKIFGRADD
jgi:hypothetical protein